ELGHGGLDLGGRRAVLLQLAHERRLLGGGGLHRIHVCGERTTQAQRASERTIRRRHAPGTRRQRRSVGEPSYPPPTAAAAAATAAGGLTDGRLGVSDGAGCRGRRGGGGRCKALGSGGAVRAGGRLLLRVEAEEAPGGGGLEAGGGLRGGVGGP